MPENDQGEKTEDPTPRRREEAREEGQVARSVELTAAASLLFALLLLRAFGPSVVDTYLQLMRALERASDVRADSVLIAARETLIAGLLAIVPFIACALAVTIAVALAQSGLLLSWKKIEIKPQHLDPIAGTKRMFSGEAVSRLMLNLVKIGVLGAVAWQAIAGRVGEVLSTGAASTGGIYLVATGLVYDLALRLGLAMLVLGIIDYMLARWRHERQLRMTKQEVRDELKRMEGDPVLKQRRRQIQRRIAMQRIRAEVPRADVVVTNPTEFAVALRYRDEKDTAPRVVAKGKDVMAQHIRRVAMEHGVPIVQRPPLARALYASVEVGAEIPPMFYRAVAELLAYVRQLSRRAG